jgi:hypothetical protein
MCGCGCVSQWWLLMLDLPACRCCEWVALQPAVRQPAGCSAAVGGVWHLCVLVGGVSCRCNRRGCMIGHPCQQQLCMLPAWWLAQQPSWVPPTSCVLVCGKARVETSAVSAVCQRHAAIREGTLCHCDSSSWADMDGGAAFLNICIASTPSCCGCCCKHGCCATAGCGAT